MTSTDLQRLIDSIDYSGNNASLIDYTLGEIIRAVDLDDATKDEIDLDEGGNVCVTVIRHYPSGRILWIVEDDANGAQMWEELGLWADTRDDEARANGWDAEEEPHVRTAKERAGVHKTGIPYAPTRKMIVEAGADLRIMRLWREVRGLPVKADAE